jgi:hypothetical protein
MASAPSPVDQAFKRYRMLAHLMEFARERALSNPTDPRNVTAELTLSGLSPREARRSIEDAFEELGGLLNHVALLDMASAFEGHFRARLGTAIGEARKVVRERHRSNIPLHAHREGLIRDTEEFQGLADIGRLIGDRVSAEVHERWEVIRRNRNSFAHGTDIRRPPTITGEQTRETLGEIFEAL